MTTTPCSPIYGTTNTGCGMCPYDCDRWVWTGREVAWTCHCCPPAWVIDRARFPMTPTKPPEAEHELALRNARALVRPVADHAVPHDPIRVMLAAALLDLHAKLAASEAAREALRMAEQEAAAHETLEKTRNRMALFADAVLALFDQTATARESAENTAEETKMPAIVSANCPAHGLGECPAGCEGRLGKPPLAEPAQPPEPVEPIEASEPFRKWVINHPYPFKPSIRDAFDAGLAAEAAAHAEAIKTLTEGFLARIAKVNQMFDESVTKLAHERMRWEAARLEGLAAHRAELEREKAAHAETRALAERYKQNCAVEIQKAADDYVRHRDHNTELIAELERVRSELAEARGWQEADRLNREMHPNGRCECAGEGACLWCRYDAAQTELAKLREGREEPSDLDLLDVLCEAFWEPRAAKPGVLPVHDRDNWLAVARAAKLALLGVRRGSTPVEANKALDRVEALAARLHADFQRRVAVPTREQLAQTISAVLRAPVAADDNRKASEACADAVLRLLSAEAKAGQPSPPVTDEPPGPGTVLGTARVVHRGKLEPREVEAPDAPGDRYVPTVGERAVLVASPDRKDKALVGRDGIIEAVRPECYADYHFGFRVEADEVTYSIHRDATWRPASTPEAAWNYSAPPDTERGKLHELLDSDHAQDGLESVMRYTGRDPDGDPAWGQGQRILGWSVKAWRPASAAPATLIDHKGSRNEVEAKAPEPGGFLDAVNAKLAHLEGKAQGMAEGAAGEFRRVDATLRAHSERIDELELQGRVTRRMAACDYPGEWWKSSGGDCETTRDMLARIEREERERAK